MAISNHQEIVVQYISADPNVFVSEEYYVGWGNEGKGEHIYIDVLAMDIASKTAFLVEVSSDANARNIVTKLNTIYSEGLDTVRAGLLGKNGLSNEWTIRPWIFIRKASAPRVIAKLNPDVFPKITYVETTAWEWEYVKARYQGDEPGKPYKEFDERYQ